METLIESISPLKLIQQRNVVVLKYKKKINIK